MTAAKTDDLALALGVSGAGVTQAASKQANALGDPGATQATAKQAEIIMPVCPTRLVPISFQIWGQRSSMLNDIQGNCIPKQRMACNMAARN